MNEDKINFEVWRDEPDERDIYFEDEILVASQNIPNKFSLIYKIPKPRCQSSANTCGAFACLEIFEMEENNKNIYSPAFLYYMTRLRSKLDVNIDSGVTLRNVCKSLQKDGVCLEELMPYDVNNLNKNPSKEAIEDAKNHKIKKYLRVQDNICNLKNILYSSRKGIMFACKIFESINSSMFVKDGIIPIPKPNEHVMGIHALVLIGFRDSITFKDKIKGLIPRYSKKGYFICLNTWQNNNNNIVYLPYEIIENNEENCFDFWLVEA